MRGIVVVAAAALAAAAAILPSCSRGPVVLRLSEVHSEDYPTTRAVREFARLVAERTEGRVLVEVHSDGRLFDEEADAVSALQDGSLDLARVSCSVAAALSPALNVIQLPYLYRDGGEQRRVLSSEAGRRVLRRLSEDGTGIDCLCWYDAGARSFYLKKEVRTAADLAGLKIRVQQNPMMVRLCELLGATGVRGISPHDVYRSILNGLVDGAENSVATYQNVGDYQAATFFVRDEHVRIPDLLLVSERSLSRLSDDDAAALRECALETEELERGLWREKEAEAERIVRAAGNTVVELTEGERSTFRAALQPLYDEYESSYGGLMAEVRAVLE